MYTIDDNNDIELVRGDTLYAKVDVFDTHGNEYIPQGGDKIRFALKRKARDPDDKLLILKDIPINTLILKLEPEDTKELRMNRTYQYDIEITKSSGDVDTFISGHLKLKEEVY